MQSRRQPLFDIVIDTNVLVASLQSRRGASFRLVSMIGQGRFNAHISVPLLLEYEDVLHRQLPNFSGLSDDDIEHFLDYICAVAHQHEVFYL